MNCQQICKISLKKNLTKVKIFQKVLGGAAFLKHLVYYSTNNNSWPGNSRRGVAADVTS